MAFTIRRAERTSLIPMMGLISESGGGKTLTAQLLARGYVGPSGKVVVIDTENGRAEEYANDVPGGYDVLPFDAPFTPQRYKQAFAAAFRSGADIVVCDSYSHVWDGDEGSVLAQAEGKKGPQQWMSKRYLKQLSNYLLRSPVPVILCMRAKRVTHWTGAGSDMRAVQDDFLTPIPITATYDCAVKIELDQSTHCPARYVTHTARTMDYLPPIETRPLGVEDGAALARWAKGDTPTPAKAADVEGRGVKYHKGRLHAALMREFGDDEDAERHWVRERMNGADPGQWNSEDWRKLADEADATFPTEAR